MQRKEKGICQRHTSHKAGCRQYITVATAPIVPICSVPLYHYCCTLYCACSLLICTEKYGVALGDESLANNADFFHCAKLASRRPSRGQQFLQEIFVLLFSLLPFLMPMLLAMLREQSIKSDFEACCRYNDADLTTHGSRQ